MASTRTVASPRHIGVLMYTDAQGFGGAELHLADLAAALVGTRYRPTALLHNGQTDSRLLALLEQSGIPLLTTGRPSGKVDVTALVEIGAALTNHRRKSGPFLMHCHQATPYANHLALAAAQAMGIPTVITDHGYYPPTSMALRLRRRWINSLADHDIAVSRAVAESVINELGQSRKKVTTVYNGVVPQPPLTPAVRAARRDAMRTFLGIPPDALLVGTVGRQAPEKNLPTLVHAMSLVAALDTRVYVVLCGQGGESLHRDLRALAAEGGWADRLALPGRLEDLQGLLAALDVFVLPSLTEGMPLSLMEAMAAGLPVVATAVGGVPELVTHGDEGLLVDDPRDITPLAEAVRVLLADARLRALMGARGARTVRSRFVFERTVSRIQQVYDHVTRRRSVG